jgi:hypothetical protein
MNLNLGQGRTRHTLDVISTDHANWKHIDVCAAYEPDECYDFSAGIREPDGSVDKVWMGDVLEHIERAKVPTILRDIRRTLKSGGQLLLVVPDMAAVMPRWLESGGVDVASDMHLSWLIWGEQDVSGNGANAGPDTHRCGFTERSLREALRDADFVNIERTRVHGVWYELAMQARKP